MPKSATSISVHDLPKLVDTAVAGLKGGHGLENGIVIDWGIIGRILRDENTSLQVAGRVAADIAQGIGQSGHALTAKGGLEPAVLMSHGRIICGFFPPPGLGLSLQSI